VAEAAGLRFIELPTPDRGTPDLQPLRALVTELVDDLARGRHVVVHRRMGIGRSSTVATAVLMAQGVQARDAWATVSDARGLEAPETPEQRRWLEAAMPLG
jgi:protein-tyrosine phosphatase